MAKHGKPTFEYSEISPQIFIGTNQCCAMHFKNDLIAKGVHVDISLEYDKIDAPFGVEFYLWLPTKDGESPTQRQLHAGVKFMSDLIGQGEKIFVHCEHGHGRAPTLVAAYLVSKEKMTPGEAFDFIKKKRPSVHPTPNQMEAVKKFSANLVQSK